MPSEKDIDEALTDHLRYVRKQPKEIIESKERKSKFNHKPERKEFKSYECVRAEVARDERIILQEFEDPDDIEVLFNQKPIHHQNFYSWSER